MADQSVTKLFSNGFFPGLLMGGTLIAIALWQAVKRGYPKGAEFSFANVAKTFSDF